MHNGSSFWSRAITLLQRLGRTDAKHIVSVATDRVNSEQGAFVWGCQGSWQPSIVFRARNVPITLFLTVAARILRSLISALRNGSDAGGEGLRESRIRTNHPSPDLSPQGERGNRSLAKDSVGMHGGTRPARPEPLNPPLPRGDAGWAALVMKSDRRKRPVRPRKRAF